jgi:hypothetical protein
MDKRRVPRTRVIKSARIISAEKVLDCVVLDLSATGARIHLTAEWDVPETVLLRLPDGAVRAARRCWQQDMDAGFEYIEVATLDEAP